MVTPQLPGLEGTAELQFLCSGWFLPIFWVCVAQEGRQKQMSDNYVDSILIEAKVCSWVQASSLSLAWG